ncbi:MAG: hypothetical protein MK033_09365 [Candidatus Caenarcaniphilales bacterium]|nr:hypothetical protein [Candidatus Caenarcaniphilales bacterium]
MYSRGYSSYAWSKQPQNGFNKSIRTELNTKHELTEFLQKFSASVLESPKAKLEITESNESTNAYTFRWIEDGRAKYIKLNFIKNTWLPLDKIYQ